MIGERLTELRTKKNMTQEEFAEYMGVTRQSVSKWELDKTYPDVEKLIRISELYNVSIDYILKGNEQQSIGLEEAESYIDGKTKNKNSFSIWFMISVVVVLMLFVSSFMIFCIKNYCTSNTNMQETPVKVEKIHNQFTVASVSKLEENGEKITELMFIDKENIREGDYVYTYIDESGDNLFVTYNATTIIIPGICLLFLIIILILMIRKLKKDEK